MGQIESDFRNNDLEEVGGIIYRRVEVRTDLAERPADREVTLKIVPTPLDRLRQFISNLLH